MDPALLAFIMVIFSTWMLRAAEAYLARGKVDKPALMVVDSPEFGIYNGYPCPVWNDNRIERELGGNDFVHCSNIECPGCFPNGRCAVAECDNPGTEEWKFGSLKEPKNEYLCGGHFNVRQIERDKLKEVMEKKAKAAELEARKGRVIELDGIEIERPEQVPEYAHAQWNRYNNPGRIDFVAWKWFDPITGERMYLKSYHPIEGMFQANYRAELEKAIIDMEMVPPILMEEGGRPTWLPPTDPESDPMRRGKRKRPNKGYA